MRFPILSTLFTALTLALPATAQKAQVFGGTGQRANSTQILFGENLVGGISVDHGQPMWKAEYDSMVDKLKGRLNRLGSNWWTTFATSFDLEIGGAKVPAGTYFLGLDCDKDGKFGLAFLDAKKGMKHGAMPFPMDNKGAMNWKPDFVCPIELHKDAAAAVVEKMTMTIKVDGNDLTGTFTIAWGKHELVGKVAVKPAKAEKEEDEDGDEEHEHKEGKKKAAK